MTEASNPVVRPDFYGQLAATDPYQSRARRLFERGQVVAVSGNQADIQVGYSSQQEPLELKQVPIISGYLPRVGDWVAIQYEAGHAGAPWVIGPSMAADEESDAAGIRGFPVSSSAPLDPQQSVMYFDATEQSWRGWDGEQWVDFSGQLHNSLPDLQGGTAGEYYHLTAAEYGALGPGGGFTPGQVAYASLAGILISDAGLTYNDEANWLTALGGMSVGAGTAAAPSLSHSGYADDGLYFPADGTLGFVTGGTERWRITAAGTLARGSAANYANGNVVLNLDDTAFAIIQGDDADGGAPSTIQFTQEAGATPPSGYGVFLAENAYYDSVAVSWRQPRAASINSYILGVTHHYGMTVDYAASGGVTDGTITPTRVLRVLSTQLQGVNGTAALPAFSNLNDTNTGIYFPAADALGFALGGAEQWRMTAGALYPIADNAEDIGTSALGLARCYFSDAKSTDVAAEGEMGMRATALALQHYIGGVIHYNGPNLSCGPTSADQKSGVGTLAEAAFTTSYTVPAAWWAAGKGLEILAAVTGNIVSASGSLTARVRIGGVAGQLLAQATVAYTTGGANLGQALLRVVLVPRARSSSASVAFSGTGSAAFGGPTVPKNDTATVTHYLVATGPNSFLLNTTANQQLVVTLEVNTAASPTWSADLDYLVVRTLK